MYLTDAPGQVHFFWQERTRHRSRQWMEEDCAAARCVVLDKLRASCTWAAQARHASKTSPKGSSTPLGWHQVRAALSEHRFRNRPLEGNSQQGPPAQSPSMSGSFRWRAPSSTLNASMQKTFAAQQNRTHVCLLLIWCVCFVVIFARRGGCRGNPWVNIVGSNLSGPGLRLTPIAFIGTWPRVWTRGEENSISPCQQFVYSCPVGLGLGRQRAQYSARLGGILGTSQL